MTPPGRPKIRCAAATVLVLASVSAWAKQDDPRLDELFAQLRQAEEPAAAQLYEDAIWRIWLESGDAALDRTMREGTRAVNQGRFEVALARYSGVIERSPRYAEGWNKRATLYFLMGRYDESVTDIERTLALEPRHFGALAGLGQIRDAQGQLEAALDAFERALELHPHLTGVRRRAEELRRELGHSSI